MNHVASQILMRSSCFSLMILAASLNLSNASDSLIRSLDLNDGDSIVFLGDSITYQTHYCEYLRSFFHTRYPDKRLSFINAGIPGNRAGDAVQRFEQDVSRFNPTIVMIMFGMNDGGYQPLDNEVRLSEYKKTMLKLINQSREINASPVIISPTPFDGKTNQSRQEDPSYRFRGKPFFPDYNLVMAHYTACCRQIAQQEQVVFVDLHSPLNNFLNQKRLSFADYTLMPDAIHPDPAGHLLMAFEILKRLDPERENIGRLSLDYQNGQWNASSSDVKFQALTGSKSKVSAQVKFQSLPWNIPEKHTLSQLRWNNPSNASMMFREIDVNSELNSTELQISGLEHGLYKVSLDEIHLGNFPRNALAAGLSLQAIQESPLTKQAQLVGSMNRRLSDEIARPLRDLLAKRFNVQRQDAERLINFDKKNRDAINRLEGKRDELLSEIQEIAKPLWLTLVVEEIQE
ncbi:SGNH/GDSL hydrolase family protein [Rubripirellula sp.]|nr:SGNH/GDSL hydrolase family protein [Rubripirellula sp.]MDB4338675.1 SGNH/GDSL hydrolase family protein [Rubripirellula sp.]